MSDAGRCNIKVYVAHAMTGKFCDELVAEANEVKVELEKYGFIVLDPIIAEGVPNEHIPLTQVSQDMLASHWRRDKEMIKDADIILDYKACNKSDGVSKELGYARFCLWKPVVRVFPSCGINISRLEDDYIGSTLDDAIGVMMNRFGSYEKLGKWRTEMWDRCFDNWLREQYKMNSRYSVVRI